MALAILLRLCVLAEQLCDRRRSAHDQHGPGECGGPVQSDQQPNTYRQQCGQHSAPSGSRDISKFAMHYIIEEVDEDTSMEDLQKMMVVALIYRLLVCFYEIICIWGAGGATPGKFLLGLRVVTCDNSVLVAPNRVLVIPSTNVNMTASTVRAVIKNFSIAFFFPAFITLLFFQHNRTAYDIVAGTIVVKRNTR